MEVLNWAGGMELHFWALNLQKCSCCGTTLLLQGFSCKFRPLKIHSSDSGNPHTHIHTTTNWETLMGGIARGIPFSSAFCGIAFHLPLVLRTFLRSGERIQ